MHLKCFVKYIIILIRSNSFSLTKLFYPKNIIEIIIILQLALRPTDAETHYPDLKEGVSLCRGGRFLRTMVDISILHTKLQPAAPTSLEAGPNGRRHFFFYILKF